MQQHTQPRLTIRPYLDQISRVRAFDLKTPEGRDALRALAERRNTKSDTLIVTDKIPLDKRRPHETRRVFIDILQRGARIAEQRARARRERLRDAERQQALAEAITAPFDFGVDELIDAIVNDHPIPFIDDLPAYTDAPKTAEQLLASARRQALKLVKPNKTVDLRATGHTTDTMLRDGDARYIFQQSHPERHFVKIRNVADLDIYLGKLVQRMLNYQVLANAEDIRLNSIDFTHMGPKTAQKVLRVAKYQPENCVMNLIRHRTDKNVDVLYLKFPQFKPTSDETPKPIYLSHTDLDDIARVANLRIYTYSQLGARLNREWSVHGRAKQLALHIVIGSEHATLKHKHTNIDLISYEHIPYIPDSTNVIEHDYYEQEVSNDPQQEDPPRMPKYYITIDDDDKITMHKAFRPSSVTRRREDDDAYNYVFTADQMMYELFK